VTETGTLAVAEGGTTDNVLPMETPRESGGDLNFGCWNEALSEVNKLGCDLEDINGGLLLFLGFCLVYGDPRWRSIAVGGALGLSGDLGVSTFSFESNTGEDLDLLSMRGLESDCLQFEDDDVRVCE
jgi:hypothetical protein